MSTRRVSTAVLFASAAISACGGVSPEPARPARASPAAAPPASSVAAAGPARALDPTPTHRRALGAPREEPLAVELLPMAGGARVLAVAESGEPTAWARTIDETGAFGKVRGFEGVNIVTAFDSADGRTTFVTSDGTRLCIATFAADAAAPFASGCDAVRPEVLVPIGDRIALVSLDIAEPKAPAPKTKSAATGGAKSTSTGSKVSAVKAAPRDASRGVKDTKRAAKKPSIKKKAPARKHRTTEPVIPPPAKAKVAVNVAWASRDGVFEPKITPAGLTFDRPLAGMMLADVAPRGAFADLLFYETAPHPKVRSKTPLGSARLGVATLGADGLLIPGTRAALTDGDLEYGHITGLSAPRLLSSAAGTALVTFAGRASGCSAERVLPALGPAVTSRAACLVDPLGWALGGGAAPQATAAAERLLSAEPRRAPGQVRADAPLVIWAGDRAVFAGASGFATAARTDGAPAAAVAPFVAKRSRIAWSAFAPDGEGVALANGAVYRIDADGAVSEAASAQQIDALGAAAAEAVRRGGGPSERRRAARIGASFWFANGDVVRLLPQPSRPAGLAHADAMGPRAAPNPGALSAHGDAMGPRAAPNLSVSMGPRAAPSPKALSAHADATALVGGKSRGMLLEVASGALRVTYLAEDGTITPGPTAPSPVRPGFDAVERSAGGAIVAGVSASDPAKVNVFTISEDGSIGAPRATSLTVAAGTFAVRLGALPGGGALLTDIDRRRAVWLSDDGGERAAAAVPDDHAPASCIDGRPAPLAVPSLEPGKVVRVAELGAAGACVVGEVAWTASGGLRWFGASVSGIDSIAEVGALDAVVAAAPAAPSASSSSATATASVSAAPQGSTLAAAAGEAPPKSSSSSPPSAPPITKPACPADMVSIAGKYCVDRFESSLVDAASGRALSPDYPPTPNLLEIVLGDWATDRAHWGDVHARAFPLPPLPAWQRGAKSDPVAVARFGARPNGYVTGVVAEAACAAAGKRLCTLDEFTTACRGEADTDFPYGVEYQDGVCNVFREDHPAALLHHNASFGHLDPRLNRVHAKGRPLFETAGARPACRSVWGSDAVYDLVGNLDEWVDEGGGAFAGGFYARSTRAGCDAVITAHPKLYTDYSTGVRCCKDAER